MKLNTLYYNPLNPVGVDSFIYLHMEIEKKKISCKVGAYKQEYFFSNHWELVKIELNFLRVKMVVKL